MKAPKYLSLFLAIIMIVSVSPIALATNISSIEENINYLKEHSNILTYWAKLRLEHFTEEIEALKSSGEIPQEKINILAAQVTGCVQNLENCLAGNHVWYYITDEATAANCTVTAYCEHCTAESTFKNNSSNSQHEDYDRDGICNLCQTEMPYKNCTHLCHSDSYIIKNIIWPLLYRIMRLFHIGEYCVCGVYHRT